MQRLAAVVAFVGLVFCVADVAFGALFDAHGQLIGRLTGLSLLPWHIASLSLLELVVLLTVCWAIPEIVFRWLILPRCPQCAARMSLLTESGIQYVCRSCGHCHDTGMMNSLAQAEGNQLDARPRAEERASTANG